MWHRGNFLFGTFLWATRVAIDIDGRRLGEKPFGSVSKVCHISQFIIHLAFSRGLKNALRTKKQRTDSYLKKQGAVSGVFENEMTSILIKGILKKKKAYVSYLTNDRVLDELLSLLLCKGEYFVGRGFRILVSCEKMARNCHEAYSVLSSRGALPCWVRKRFLLRLTASEKPDGSEEAVHNYVVGLFAGWWGSFCLSSRSSGRIDA